MLAPNVSRPVKAWPTTTRTIDIEVVRTSVLCNLLFQPLQKEQEITKTVSIQEQQTNKQTHKQTTTTTKETTNKQNKRRQQQQQK